MGYRCSLATMKYFQRSCYKVEINRLQLQLTFSAEMAYSLNSYICPLYIDIGIIAKTKMNLLIFC